MLASLVLAPSQVLATSVDLELLLLVDVSGSIDSSEFALQRTGYVNAFNNPSLVTAIQNGSIGSIAVSLVYWSGTGQQQQAVSWTLINDATSATAFATAVGNAARPYAGGNTALGEALQVGGALFPNNSFEGTRDVIDVSGDGATNTGISSSTGRASALAAGVDTINGLVILGESGLLATTRPRSSAALTRSSSRSVPSMISGTPLRTNSSARSTGRSPSRSPSWRWLAVWAGWAGTSAGGGWLPCRLQPEGRRRLTCGPRTGAFVGPRGVAAAGHGGPVVACADIASATAPLGAIEGTAPSRAFPADLRAGGLRVEN